ncbi:MFS family permease [Paraburkholderia sp. GAS448]
MAREFHATAASAQLTTTLYIVGLSIGQLIYGPISDRFGRRPVLLLGLVLYTVASVAASLSPSLGALVAARVAQALGGCVGLVLGRTIAHDGDIRMALGSGCVEHRERRRAVRDDAVIAGNARRACPAARDVRTR